MIIEVKAVQGQQEEPKGARKYEFNTAEKLSRLPAYIGVLALAVVTYVRSLTSAEARPHPDQASTTPDASTGAINHASLSTQMDNVPEEGVDETTTGSIDGGEGRRGLGVEQGNAWPGPFQVPEFPKLYFVEPSFYVPNIPPFVPVTVMGQPTNDNAGLGPQLPDDAPAGAGPVGRNPGGGNDAGLHPQLPELPDGTGPGPDPDLEDPDGGTDDDGEQPQSNNRSPIVMGPVRLHDIFAGQVVLIAMNHLLFGAYDPDQDSLEVTNLVAQGVEIEAGQNGWSLITRPGMVGPVTLSFEISDGDLWVSQIAQLDIVRKLHLLTPQADVHSGSPYDDDIDAGAGNDLVDALAGNDHVEGGSGDDHIIGGDGDDALVGGSGDDAIFGGKGDDVVHGGAGDDRLFGEDGEDTIFGEDGDDHLDGGAGGDMLTGGAGNDTLYGLEGDDRMIGGAGADMLVGGVGNDLLDGGTGGDQLMGGAGNDVLADGAGCDIVDGGDGDDVLIAGGGVDVLDGGAGHDTLNLAAASDDVVVDMIGGTSFSQELGVDTFEDIEEVVGGSGDDLFVIGGKATILWGGRGRDTFVFEVTDSDPTLSENTVHKILDFVIGDRVRVRDYYLDRDAREAERDLFEAVYGDDDDDWLDSDVPIQTRHERIDDEDWTVILADVDRDDKFDVAINIQGLFLPATDHV